MGCECYSNKDNYLDLNRDSFIDFQSNTTGIRLQNKEDINTYDNNQKPIFKKEKEELIKMSKNYIKKMKN